MIIEYYISTFDCQEIEKLLLAAEEKISIFEKKIGNISSTLEPLKAKREAVLAALEYANREEDRRKLTGGFLKDGEYGLPINFSKELLYKLELRKNELDARIDYFEKKREKRLMDIEFTRKDIELLKKAQCVEIEAHFFEAAAIIDD
jgi:hypothetical protein